MPLITMLRRHRTYKTYAVGCLIAWAIVLTAVYSVDSRRVWHNVLLFFAGWMVGWVSATIARSVYPHPGAKQR